MIRAPEGTLLFINLHASDLDDEDLASPTAPLAGMATLDAESGQPRGYVHVTACPPPCAAPAP